MSYRLDSLVLDIPGALRRCAAEQLADAGRQLREERAVDPVEAVHDARKDLKKARSLLRLARPGLPKEAYRAENDAMRDVARRLSDVRDADVMVETADALAKRFAGALPKRALPIVRRRFVLAARRSRAAADEAISEDLLGELAAIEARAAEWPLEDCDRGVLRAGATVAYARGRDRLAIAEADPSVFNLHEWRKRVKDLWYHARLLEGAFPALLEAYGEAAHALSDLLGDDHDLAVLVDRIAEGTWPPSVDGPALIGLAHQRRAELQTEAFALGHKIYAERPKAFSRRLGAYLNA